MRKRHPIFIILAVLLLGVAVFSGYKVTSALITGYREQRAFKEIESIIVDIPAAGQSQIDSLENDERFSAVYEMNNDFYGWIKISGTKINYPVMQTKSDPEYYLRRNFFGEYSVSGTPFIDADCSEDTNHYIIYGHQMQNGTMFGGLKKYAQPDYFEKHRMIQFDTMTESRRYEIFAVFYSRIYSVDEDGFRYYFYKDLSDESVFNEYISECLFSSLYDTGIIPEYGDEIITLSTCSYHEEDGRFVVVARSIS